MLKELKGLRKSVLICVCLSLFLILSGCASRVEREVVVQKEIVEVQKWVPEELKLLCEQPELEGDSVKDVIVLATRMRNAITVCNMRIAERNKL
jgi:hypothetical protein